MSALGVLPGAPLIMVAAAIKFSKNWNFAGQLPNIGSALQAHYPRYAEINLTRVEAGLVSPASFKIHRFQSLNSRSAVLVSDEELVFVSTEYRDYPEFAGRLREVIEIANLFLDQHPVDFMGMRYIDYIVPQVNDTLADYLKPGLLGLPAVSPGAPLRSINVSEQPINAGQLRVRTFIVPGAQFAPPDFNVFDLKPCDLATIKVPDTTPTAIVDIDRFNEYAEPFTVEGVLSGFAALHVDQSLAFEAIRTPYAVSMWQKGPR